MAQVEVQIHGRPYMLACADGEEMRLRQLADYLDNRVTKLARGVGNVGEAKLLLLLSLTLADELAELNSKLTSVSRETRATSEEGLAGVADHIERLAKRIEIIADRVAA